jgi:Fe-S-cluster containining protein
MTDWRYPGLGRDEAEADPCEGCQECGLRCTAGVQMTRLEFDRIVDYLRQCDGSQVLRVLEQEKRRPWFEDIETEYCIFYDVSRERCFVYPARPFICRLFGHVEWLPCPQGKPVPQIEDGLAVIQAYARQKRKTFAEWCAETGLYDFRQLASRGGRARGEGGRPGADAG